MKVNQVVDKKEELVNHILYTILGAGVYSMSSLLCIGVGMMVPGIALAVYLAYGLVGVGLGCLATHILKEDIKEYKKYKAKVKPYYEHFPFVVSENEYEKRPRYQVDREIDCKVEDFYKEQFNCSSDFVYEKEDNQSQKYVILTKKKKYRG